MCEGGVGLYGHPLSHSSRPHSGTKPGPIPIGRPSRPLVLITTPCLKRSDSLPTPYENGLQRYRITNTMVEVA
jgi:hypothetical protein